MKKQQQLKGKFNFKYFKYPKSNVILSETIIDSLLDQFYSTVVKKMQSKVIMLQLILETDKKYRSLSTFININKETQKDSIKTIILERIHLINESYYDLQINSLFIRYKFLEESDPLSKVNLLESKTQQKNTNIYLLKSYNLLKSMNIQEWKNYLVQNLAYHLIRETEQYFKYFNPFNKTTLSIDILEQMKHHKISLSLNRIEILSFIDISSKTDPTVFHRHLSNGNILKYKDGKQVLLQHKVKPVAFLSILKKDIENKYSFITLNLESRKLENGNLEVVSASFFNGISYYTYFLSDYKNSKEMLKTMIKKLFLVVKEGKGQSKIYVHEFSKFGGNFLLGLLAELSSTFHIIKRDENLISLHISKKWSKNNISKLTFLDSSLILPEKLSKLSVSFGIKKK